MTDPLERNRLGDAASPYLRQHADNPVNWQPWDESAHEAARERDRPIFLSVGYAACHWCHVMAHESFEDEAVAEVLNDHYVPIKVDREERPDVDRVYQTICQLVTRGGGWPLSVWLTPDGRPFYVGTYFPPTAQGNRPGFRELASGLADAWANDREEIDRRADQWMDAIRGEVETVSTPDAPAGGQSEEPVLEAAAGTAVRSADREAGGFGSTGPKFPQPGRLHLLLRAADRTGRAVYREVATEALDAMANGGMYDHLGGGFHRYATDRDWTVPHFEKMLYDNAELPRVYLAGYQLTGTERYATVARETLAFVERELSHPEGGFYSTLDAQSERDGERTEGAFYVWTPDEVRDVLEDPDQADRFCTRYGVSESGNFEGRTVLGIKNSIEAIAEEAGESPSSVEADIDRARTALFTARSDRPRPRRDEKILASWNGLAIQAFAEAGIVLERSYADRARDALSFVREHLWDGDRLKRRYEGGDVGVSGTLDDYAFLARGALACYEATGAVDPLAFALDLGRGIVTHFHDEDSGALYLTPDDATDLAVRPQDLTDQSTPSAAGVATEVLLALEHFDPDAGFGAVAERALDTYRSRVRSNPMQHASLALAEDRLARGFFELTVVASTTPPSWRTAIGRTYLPDRLLSRRPVDIDPWVERLGLGSVPPIWAERGQVDDEPTVYACRNRTCSRPLSAISEALSWNAS